uniref:uncharacterized protein LOC132669551 isoform X1 n=1 Tax=Panthera onca TaxID=9690 RepID=UPI002952C757|nr:uncharacterized protein LOC132669551 isoform X1 [Panthera onca]XP_060475496.1 uncharacterized protein LOC132669551 isoform X1 [Panthera onca]
MLCRSTSGHSAIPDSTVSEKDTFHIALWTWKKRRVPRADLYVNASCFSQGSQAFGIPGAGQASISRNARTSRPHWFFRALGVVSVRLKQADARAGRCHPPLAAPPWSCCGKEGVSSQPGSSLRVLCAPACAARGWHGGSLGGIPDGHIDPQCIQRLHIWRNVLVTSVCRVPAGPPPRMYSCFQTLSPTNSFKCTDLGSPRLWASPVEGGIRGGHFDRIL